MQMQGKGRVAIAYNNTDITFKALTEAFRDKVLDFYGLKLGRVKSIERADPTIRISTSNSKPLSARTTWNVFSNVQETCRTSTIHPRSGSAS